MVWLVVILVGIGLLRILVGSQSAPSPKPALVKPTVLKPFPAASPTVASSLTSATMQPQKTKPQEHPVNEDGASNLSPALEAQLTKVVRIYASWPGDVPKEQLLGQLGKQQPFINKSVLDQVQRQWQTTPSTFTITVKKVIMDSDLLQTTRGPNSGVVTVYASLLKHFKPLSGHPYDQTAIQPYQVSLRIIKRAWQVVGITTQVSTVSVGS